MNMYFYLIYWSYLVFPLILICFFKFRKYVANYKKNKIRFYINLFIILILFLFTYSRFIEPQIIVENEYFIDVWFKWRIVVISDIHLWIYKDANFLKRVVNKINNLNNIDAVLIAWDLTYHPENNIESLFEPLRHLKYKTYAVIGNHDDGNPWIPIENEIKIALQNNQVEYLHNTKTIIPNTNIKLLWLWDCRESWDDVRLITQYKKEDNLIALTHNPDTTLKYSKNTWEIADITITGHTHGWQIRIPFLYKHVIPTIWSFDEWFYNIKWAKLFISSWLWEVWLPMRLWIPPTIDIINFR